jgi:hypothetical protein
MQNDTSQFVVNIIPLQNIQTNTSGLDDTAQLSNSVANIQQMVNFEQKRIYTDFLSAYTTGNTIQVLSPMNMSNGDFTVGGTSVTGGTSGSTGNSISASNTSITLYSTGTTAISMVTSGNTALSFSNTGQAVFTGNVYAQQFITLSDASAKTNIRTFNKSVLSGISLLEPKVFQYCSSPGFRPDPQDGEEVGLIAQELESIFPECVKEGPGGKKYINYQSLTIVLLKAIQELALKV